MAALSTPPGRNLLEGLPPELQLRIFEHTGYGDAFKLIRLNKHFHGLVKPEKWPAEDKAKFVQKAQHFVRHNQMHAAHWPSGTWLVWRTNSHACYKCYRVRLRRKFAKSQITGKRAKDSPRDRDIATGCGRFCMDCAVNTGIYRHGTRLLTLTFQAMRPNRKHTSNAVLEVFCADCKYFTESKGRFRDAVQCECCYEWVTLVSYPRSYYQRRLMAGNTVCGDFTMGGNKRDRKCLYCAGDICHSCGCIVDEHGNWWCGLACSRGGWAQARLIDVEQWQAYPKLLQDVDGKRDDRMAWELVEKDVLEKEDLENALSWLSL
ncbi:hypothetical protein LTR42_012738 [Elasticomyces elasticus]|nr:hypothetical protein LTR42_012738 [Elasticomyces elasticus]